MSCSRCGAQPRVNKSWCRDCRNTYNRAWRAKNVERERAKAMERYYADPARSRRHAVKYRLAHPDRVAAWHRTQYLRRRGITQADLEALTTEQGGRCGICGTVEPPLFIDHDHACCNGNQRACKRCIRGLLCRGCNRFLAWTEKYADVLPAYLDGRAFA